ncbi:MAG: RagB/SusD family nutrient uptake outer membrane protein, partial [Rikenellaceae bacterium]
DLDSAVFYLSSTSPDGRNNRIHKDVATFLQSRVALFEGTWLKNFKGTAFVPQGPEWPGAQNAATKNYKFPSGSIDAEVDYFLTVAMKTAKVVADKYPLTPNTGVRLTKEDDVNPYVSQFGDPDLGKYQEVLIWRAFASGLKSHNVNRHLTRNNAGIGLTRALVRSFVDKNGLPPYATGALWGDAEENDMYKVTKDRDSRAQLFIKTPGQINTFKNNNAANASICFFTEPVPPIWIMNDAWGIYDTGYAHAKGMYPDADFCATSKGVTASPAYRSAEAYLNYIEACYEKTGAIDGDADRYWKAIRVRAKVAEERGGDYQVTIAATDMKEEGKLDWAAYTAGKLVDPTLYNIRRERRCEMMAEGRRFTDLCRWRAMDQMMTTRYRQEGIKIWHSPNEKVIADAAKAEGGFITIGETVSAPEKSNFLCPHEIVAGDPGMDLFTWKMAHYLKPIFIKHLLITSPQTHDAAGSSLYQNPYWPLDAGSIATK